MKIEISICTGLMLNDHSNPYIESTTVLSDTCIVNYPYMLVIYLLNLHTVCIFHSSLELVESVINLIVLLIKRHRLLTDRLIKQGFWYSKLCSSFIKFARRHSAEICKYRVSIRTHVVEGICIPLDVRHDLVRNVTTRGRGRGNTCT